MQTGDRPQSQVLSPFGTARPKGRYSGGWLPVHTHLFGTDRTEVRDQNKLKYLRESYQKPKLLQYHIAHFAN